MDTNEARISPDNGKANGNNATQTESSQFGTEKPNNGIRAGTALPNDLIPTFPSPVSTRCYKGNGKSSGSGGPSAVEQKPDRPSPTRITTDFEVLPDGTLVELVRGEKSAWNELRFLIWKAGNVSIVESYEHDGRLLTPPEVKKALYEPLKLRLPTGVEACPTARELFVTICDFIRELVDLPEASIRIVAAFALSTWYDDRLKLAPYLYVCGPPESGKTTLLRLLHCLCRRAVLVAGPITPAIYSLPEFLRPTLLLDELRFDDTHKADALECWLRAGSAPGVPVGVGGQLVDGFGAKVLCSRQPVADTALASRGLHIAMVPSDNHLLPLREEELQAIAKLQNRLLMFRLLHYWEYESEYEPGFLPFLAYAPRMQELADALLLPFREDQETTRALEEAFADQHGYARAERHREPECLVITALFGLCHRKEKSTLFVGEVAALVNAARKRLNEEADLKARKVGAILKAIGLATEGISSFGRGLRLTTGVRRKIHELVRAYGMQRGPDPTSAKCSFCADTFGGGTVGKASTAEKANA